MQNQLLNDWVTSSHTGSSTGDRGFIHGYGTVRRTNVFVNDSRMGALLLHRTEHLLHFLFHGTQLLWWRTQHAETERWCTQDCWLDDPCGATVKRETEGQILISSWANPEVGFWRLWKSHMHTQMHEIRIFAFPLRIWSIPIPTCCDNNLMSLMFSENMNR